MSLFSAIGKTLTSTLKTGANVADIAFRSPLKGSLVLGTAGGTIGSIAGALEGEGSSTQQFGSILEGATTGMAAGFGLRSVPFAARQSLGIKGIEKNQTYLNWMFNPKTYQGSVSRMKGIGKGTYRAGKWLASEQRAPFLKSATTGIAKTANWMMMNPGKMTLGGLAAGGLYIGGQAALGTPSDESPYFNPPMEQQPVNYNQQMIQAQASQQMNRGAIAPMGKIGLPQQVMPSIHRNLMQSTMGVVQGLHNSRH